MIYKLKGKSKYYIYDIPSNVIVEVNKAVYDMIEEFRPNGKNPEFPQFKSIEPKYRLKMEYQDIRNSYDEISHAIKDHKLFTFKMPASLRMNRPDSCLDNSLGQLILNVTERCNMRCSYCVYSGKFSYERTHSDKMMNAEVARRAIEYFMTRTADSGTIAVSFYGGEPLLNFSVIREAVEFSRQLHATLNRTGKLVFSITTNGTLLNNEEIRRFLEINKFSLVVSLDGPKSVHDSQRRYLSGKGTFDHIQNNLGLFNNECPVYIGESLGFSCVSYPNNAESATRYFSNNKYLEKSRKIFFAFTNYLNSTLIGDPEISRQRLSFMRAFNRWRHEYKSLLIKGDTGSTRFKVLSAIFDKYWLPIYKRERRFINEELWPNGICLPGHRRIFVSVDGGFHVCEKLGESIRIGSIDEGLDKEAIRNLVNHYISISQEDCLQCWALRLCGACYVVAKVGDHLSREFKHRAFCSGYRILLSRVLADYCDVMNDEYTRDNAEKYFGHIEVG